MNNLQTLSDAKDVGRKVLEDRKAVLVDPQEFEDWLAYGGMRYGTQERFTCKPLASLKGKNSRAGFHCIIYRNDHGTYEVNAYVS